MGDHLGSYELVQLVGRGGMGAVWAARRAGERDAPLVALKTLRPEDAGDETLRTMFLDEVRIASALRHPGACRVFEAGADEGRLYLAMEWVEGESLAALLERRARAADANDTASRARACAFPEAVALRIVARVCDTLHAAHELQGPDGAALGLVHRDVSPHNVLLAADGTVKLIDFGIAKARARIADTTRSGVLKGKLRYMAPEQVEGASVDRRADVWSLGAVLYALASGNELFSGTNEADVVRTLVMRAALPKPFRPLSSPVAAVVWSALTFEPDERTPTALDLRRALDDALAALGEAPEPLDAPSAELQDFARDALEGPLASRRRLLDAPVDPSSLRPVRPLAPRAADATRRARKAAIAAASVGAAVALIASVASVLLAVGPRAAAAPRDEAPAAHAPSPPRTPAAVETPPAPDPAPTAAAPATSSAPARTAKPREGKPRGAVPRTAGSGVAPPGHEFDTRE